MSSKSVVFYKSNALRKYLQTFSRKQRSQCCLIISSSKGPTSSKREAFTDEDDNQLSNLVHSSIFAMTVEAGMRNVQSNIIAAYPTVKAVQESLELARRAGAQLVIGIGSGAAIDLAKAVAAINPDNAMEIILSPATLGASMASTSDDSLILSTEEEALLPLSSALDKKLIYRKVPTTILVDENDIVVAAAQNSSTLQNKVVNHHHQPLTHGAIASLTIALDSALYLSETNDSGHLLKEYNYIVHHTIQHAIGALHEQQNYSNDSENPSKSRKLHAINATLHSGKLLNLGNHKDSTRRRSAPISIASSLLPPFFPHGNILTFMASMLPGMCETIANLPCSTKNEVLEKIASQLTGKDEKSLYHLAEWANEIVIENKIPSMASLAEGAPAISTLLDRMDCNHALLNNDSEDLNYLSEILQRSLNR